MSKRENQKRAQEAFTASGELRGFIQGELSTDNDILHEHTGLTQDKEVMDLLNHMARAYEPSHPDMPYDFKDTEAGRSVIKSVATEVGTKAVKEGNISQMKFLTGLQDYTKDVSGLHTLRELLGQLRKDAYIAYLFGHMGNGKTDFANLFAELSKEELGYEIASNQKSLEEKDKYIYTFGELLNWFVGGEVDISNVSDIDEFIEIIEEKDIEVEDKLFVFDEGSNYASGYSQDAYETQNKLGRLVKLIRKLGGSLIIIGHTGKDVHPDLRRLAIDCIKKTGKKSAKFFETVQESEGVGLKFELSGVPKTNYTYDTLEVCFWDWTLATQEEAKHTAEKIEEKTQDKKKRNLEIAKTYVTNSHEEISTNRKGKITQEMLAEHYNLSVGRISSIIKEVEEEGRKVMEED